MDDKRDAGIDEVANETLQSEAEANPVEEDAAEEAIESIEAEAEGVAEDAAATAEEAQDVAADAEEDAETAEADLESAEDVVVEAEDTAAEDTEDAKDEASKAEEAADVDVESSDAEQIEAAPKRKESSIRIGDLVAVGVLSIILGTLLVLPSILGTTNSDSSSAAGSGSAAATVNGVVISEDQVTKYVMDFRTKQGFESDEDWGQWMAELGYDAESLRSDTIDYFVERELLKQAIDEHGVSVEDSAVDDYIASISEQVGGED